MKRVLLGSTAIIGAGMFLANPAHAQLEVVLSGYTEFGTLWSEEEELLGNDEQNFDFFMDNEVFVNAQGVDDATGITYGSKVELEVGTGADDDVDTFTDEVVVFFSGAFGRIELGQEDGAADVMFLGGENVAAGTGGIDGDLPLNISGGQIIDTGDATKATYFTPRVGGFQAGISYVPDGLLGEVTDPLDPTETVPIDTENFVEAGVNFVGQFAGLDVGVAGIASLPDGFDDLEDGAAYGVGGTVGFAGLNFGASYGWNDVEIEVEGVEDFEFNAVDFTFLTAGVGFGLGPANASFTYEYDDFDDGEVDDSHYFVGSADVGLMPGVILKGDLGYRTDAPQVGGDDTWAGVVTVQLNY